MADWAIWFVLAFALLFVELMTGTFYVLMIALAAAANGAAVVGVHVHNSYRDGFDLVEAIRAQGVKAYVVQADVTNTRDLWASRSYIIEQNGNKALVHGTEY